MTSTWRLHQLTPIAGGIPGDMVEVTLDWLHFTVGRRAGDLCQEVAKTCVLHTGHMGKAKILRMWLKRTKNSKMNGF